ncbi:glycosyl transferase family 1 [Kangiella profundi]|uniref:Glycosyl transferase family 1 n=1 Tax=Kangiella profundi TaxID=1561924 RepID=A0A2K9A6Z9_9GAMM|nr:glycosyltransferase [Kangiella profundi]AUD78510.1 glycosyl transferase family 1 [Kangiella profundi]GGF08502.1 capsular polysaccharide biosynthesis protein [Kangiella profundi]
MIVWNEFLTDARVLKEAQSLINAGHNVTVHAIHTPNKTKEREVLPGGVKVVRVTRNALWGFRKRFGLKPRKKAFHLSENNSNSQSTKPISPTNVKPSRFKTMLKPMMRALTHIGLCRALVKSKPDVIHSHDVNTLIVAWIASKIARVPLVYDAHEISTSREGYQKIRKYVGWVEKKLMPKAIATITTTDMRAKFFARAYGIPRPTVLQNRPSFYELKNSNRIRDELSLEQQWPIIVYQGGIQPGRGLERLVQAAQVINNVYFVLIGSGRLVQPMQIMAEELGVSDKVKFIPVVPLAELPEYTASADIGIQPILNTCLNHYSTDSNKLFEYVLAGLPVIATDFPEIRKIVNQYGVGELADESHEGLVFAINKLLQDTQLREKYKLNALKARKELSWESQEKALVNLYQKILN